MYNIIKELNCQSRFDAGYRKLGEKKKKKEVWGWCTGMTIGMVWGGNWEEGSGWGTSVHPWWMHVDVWQNQYNIVK